MEHTGPAWTPRYTLTPSALDTWFWEEGRVLGVQGDWWTTTANETELKAFGGFGWGPDQQGILLARRGWVMSDWLAGMNSTMPLPPGGTTNEFEERDGRPAVYVGGNVRDPWKIGELHAGYFDNLGDLSVKGVWETRYATVGVSAAPLPGLDLMFQYLIGKTNNRSGPFDNTIQAFYPLASYRWRGHRISVRYDNFRVQDDRHAAPFNRERGWAVTVAYLFEFWLRHRIGFEYIIPDSHRPDPGGFLGRRLATQLPLVLSRACGVGLLAGVRVREGMRSSVAAGFSPPPLARRRSQAPHQRCASGGGLKPAATLAGFGAAAACAACLMVFWIIIAGTAAAADLTGRVVDTNGAPLADAVVFVQSGAPPPAAGTTPTAVIDQIGRQFVPHVLTVAVGTAVSFPNHDQIHHHVYSFSDAKTFEFGLYKGEQARRWSSTSPAR